ncbi:transposase domain-containing protein [Solidesulfovibrio fructosivorans]|uniref:transposase domain-containing protein n=1 Tax=Solidesulfovibrio fructosivorans TaxID=878 RepID=UPI0009D73607
MYSLTETAKVNGLVPYRYLRHLFEHLPTATSDAQRKALLPPYIAPKSLIIPT